MASGGASCGSVSILGVCHHHYTYHHYNMQPWLKTKKTNKQTNKYYGLQDTDKLVIGESFVMFPFYKKADGCAAFLKQWTERCYS